MGNSNAPVGGGLAAAKPVVYVVDDSPDLTELLEVLLTGAGYPTRVFHDPREALESLCAASEPPRLLVTDFQMPGMNGLELIARCRAARRDLKVISASGNMPDTRELDPSIRPDSVLPKPYSSGQLVELVQSLLRP